jgi:hypothetical protein
MYADAKAIAKIAELAGRKGIANKYRDKAMKLKKLVQNMLWDEQAKFFKVRLEAGNLCDARAGYEEAWKQLMDPEGFYAPFGPTTAEQRHPGFTIAYKGDDCQWNGPSWPYSTTQVLTALANLLNNYQQEFVTKTDYLETLKIYTKSHRHRLADGRVVPWIDEDLDPYTGEWVARVRKLHHQDVNGRHRPRQGLQSFGLLRFDYFRADGAAAAC